MYSPAVRMKWRLKRSDSFRRPPVVLLQRPGEGRQAGGEAVAHPAPAERPNPPRDRREHRRCGPTSGPSPLDCDSRQGEARARFRRSARLAAESPPLTPPAAPEGLPRAPSAAGAGGASGQAGCHQGRLAALSHAPWRSPRRRLRSRRSCRTCRTSRRRRPRSCRRSRRRRSLTAATPMRRYHCSRSACRPTSPSLIEHTHSAAASLSTEGPARARRSLALRSRRRPGRECRCRGRRRSGSTCRSPSPARCGRASRAARRRTR